MSGTVDHEPTVSQTVTDGPNPEGSHGTRSIAVNTADVTLEPDEVNENSGMRGTKQSSDLCSV